jgi:hypothetical protein
MNSRRKPIPKGSTLPVLLTKNNVLDIREHTFANQDFLKASVVERNGSLRFDWSLEDIEIIQGYVAASANHTKDRKLERRLELIYSKLEVFLDSYVEQPDSS